ncbi:proline--tRNA ligase [Thiotrichales bacterium 19S3-7]|nr:proline--tRNA ligase [Thiotrichales bacterium 19S3-7]MCF6801646.1 proline--tRNA ligase [Thiotrichales bacterium 19S3-11]
MRMSQTLLATKKEMPKDAELISHQLMLRAGLIRKLTSGIYSWLPTGLKVIKKIEAIVREEMNASGACELLMPSVLPKELIQQTNRWHKFGGELLKVKDRHDREYCYGPTHEEVITDIARDEIRSYKQLPLNLYQIQTKFRDEIRPRFGVMRAREFIMKDAYSFHIDKASLNETYQVMYQTYVNILNRLGLKFRAVEADAGAIGGSITHEFQVLAESGEDLIYYSDGSDYAANVEKATYLLPDVSQRLNAAETLTKFATPKVKTIEQLAKFLSIDKKQTVKTLIIKDRNGQYFACVLRGDHQLNELKLGNLTAISEPFEMATETEVKELFDADIGSIGPVNSPVTVIVDYAASMLNDFIAGANENDFHYRGCNWDRDIKNYITCDIRNVEEGDLSPDGKGQLKSIKGIEVGHVFQLGDTYSVDMNACVLDEQGKAKAMMMGCYGFGISRIVAASIEQLHDEHGIIWPCAIAPYQVSLIGLNAHKNTQVKQACDDLYQKLLKAGFDVIYDDRNERAGVMFADSDLIGIPHRLVIGPNGLKEQQVEYKYRTSDDRESIKLDQIIEFLNNKIN